MIEIKEFITRSRDERRSHLDLSSPCCERGGNSTNHKGVLAQYLDTTIPSGRILLCHGCHNGKCSNPKHLYWGTDVDNLAIDRAEQPGGFPTIWERAVAKYGEEEARRRNSRKGLGNTYGSGNKGKPKSEEHKAKIAANHKGGRKKNSATVM
jgi:hypothetical protein